MSVGIDRFYNYHCEPVSEVQDFRTVALRKAEILAISAFHTMMLK
jgi:hypothetical protein